MIRATRRQFCEHALLGVASSVALSALGCRSHAAPPGPAPQATPDSGGARSPLPKTLAVAEFATLSAVCERLLPRDQDPGATDLGVPSYIDAMIATHALAPVREMLSKVLPIIDKESRKRFGRAFAEISAPEQDTVLESWQHGTESRQHAFDAILSLTLEGAFGDPKYGGNTGGRGFALIGFTPDPPLRKMPSMANMHHGNAPN